MIKSEEFRLSVADQATRQLVPELIDKASETISQSNVPPYTDTEMDTICDRFKLKEYHLHPRSFVLAGTLEWIRLPADIAGYIIGKSRWGRRGLIIATAAAVHPGFKGCLTLELTNLGEVPITITPRMPVGQLCLHRVQTAAPERIDQSGFVGQRRPSLGS